MGAELWETRALEVPAGSACLESLTPRDPGREPSLTTTSWEAVKVSGIKPSLSAVRRTQWESAKPRKHVRHQSTLFYKRSINGAFEVLQAAGDRVSPTVVGSSHESPFLTW